MLIIAQAIGALAGYSFYVANNGEPYQFGQTIGCGIVLFVTFAGAIAIRSATGRSSVANISVLSGVFFVVILIEQVLFTFLPFWLPPYLCGIDAPIPYNKNAEVAMIPDEQRIIIAMENLLSQ